MVNIIEIVGNKYRCNLDKLYDFDVLHDWTDCNEDTHFGNFYRISIWKYSPVFTYCTFINMCGNPIYPNCWFDTSKIYHNKLLFLHKMDRGLTTVDDNTIILTKS